MKTHKRLCFGLVILFLSVLAGSLSISGHAKALTSFPTVTIGNFKFVDAAHITGTINGNPVTFYDSSDSDSTRNFQPQGMDSATWCNYGTGGDQRWGINIDKNADLTKSSLEGTIGLGVLIQNGNKTSCEEVPASNLEPNGNDVITITNPNSAAASGYSWQGANIVNANGGETFVPKPANGTTPYIDESNAGICEASSIIILNSPSTGTKYDLTDDGPNSVPANISKFLSKPGNCKLSSQETVSIAGTAPSSVSGNGSGSCSNGDPNCNCTYDAQLSTLVCSNSGTTTPAGQQTASSSDCVFQSNSGGWETALNWILCPVIRGLSASADGINGFVSGQLNFSVSDNLGTSVQKAWSTFKDIASAVVVIVMLVMVISQAIGGGPFDAYTVRKMLPKLVAAIILMQLSWYLCIWLIELANDAGQGIAELMAAPFGGLNSLELGPLLYRLSSVWAGIVGAGTEAGLIGAIIFGGTLLAWGWPVLVMGLVLVLIAVIVAMLTLLFRNALIILLVILSPLAFLTFVLPGTDRYWKYWKDNFTKLLVFFPLVMAIIYAGRIFAWTAGNLGSPGPFDLIMVLGGFFGPYFFLPKTFKWGGGILAEINKGIAESAPIKKGRELAARELVSGEDSAMKRRMGHWASEYRDVDENNKKIPWRKRTLTSLAAGRFIPTQRSKSAMVARGGAFTAKEGELKKALASRRRKKAAEATGDVSVGKDMDLNTIQAAMNEIAEERKKRRPNPYKIKDLEREAKEAMNDLVDTSSTLELNSMKVKYVDPKTGQEKSTHVWRTPLWRSLLNDSPELYGKIKGDAPDWVPHRNPIGLPKYRGDFDESQEIILRRNMAMAGRSQQEIESEVIRRRTDPKAEFLRTAGGHSDYIDDVQYASALLDTVQEADAGSIARVHPTYFERIGDLAERGKEAYDRGEETGDVSLQEVGKSLMAPAKEFGSLALRIASTHGGRNQLGAMMGGSDTMEHLDRALQYSDLRDAQGNLIVNATPGTNWQIEQKGHGSMEKVIAYGAQLERQSVQPGSVRPAAQAPAAAPAAQEAAPARPAPTAAAPAAGAALPGAWQRQAGGGVVFTPPAQQAVQPGQMGAIELHIDHEALGNTIRTAAQEGTVRGMRHAARDLNLGGGQSFNTTYQYRGGGQQAGGGPQTGGQEGGDNDEDENT